MILNLNFIKNTVLLFVLVLISCGSQTKKNNDKQQNAKPAKEILVGANQIGSYLPKLRHKNVGIVANQTSVIFKNALDSIFEVSHDDKMYFSHIEKNDILYTHLVDSLLALGVNIKKVFAPEHGFRGTADAGEVIKDGIDTKTGLPIVSLYGDNKKPTTQQLKGLDIVVFDIQDVGARFYTYISTLHYVMESCAENNIPLLILDRPNPNGHYIDGPILEVKHKSFVGMHPVPIVHGMTIGEYAKMINGEGWLHNGIKCDITIIPAKHYTHNKSYSLPIKPSPNLPNDMAINLYPSLCFFEGTDISVGRGTSMQFQVAGSPYLKNLKQFYFEFTPQPNEGAKYPKHQDKLCFGLDFRNSKTYDKLDIYTLISFYQAYKRYATQQEFFNTFFTKLAGTKTLQKQIESGLTEDQIRATWQEGINNYKKVREHYLIYN